MPLSPGCSLFARTIRDVEQNYPVSSSRWHNKSQLAVIQSLRKLGVGVGRGLRSGK
jgi:hypothetical protein